MLKLKAILITILLGAAPPLLLGQITETYTFATNRMVPDGNASGLHDVRAISSAISQITDVKVKLKVAGEFNGDLYAFVRHSTGFSVLLNRVGRTGTNPAGYDDSGFDVTFSAAAPGGDVHLYRSVATPAAGSPLTGEWQPDGRAADPGIVTDTSSRAALLSSFTGLNASGEWTLYLVDLESGGTNMLTQWALEITGAAAPAIAWAPPADITYGESLGAAQLNATVTFDGTNVNGTFAYTPAAGTVLNAGAGQALSVTFTPADATAFLPVTTNVAIDVLKAPLTIAAQDKSKVYGAGLPSLTATYTGFVNGDTAASLDTPVALATAATATSSVGTYAITTTGAADANYAITHVDGSLSVTPAPLTVTAANKSKLYGAPLPVFTAGYSGFVNGDTEASLDTPPAFDTLASQSSAVGAYAINVSGAADVNYTITHVPGTLTIAPATITVAAHNQTKAYGQALPAFSASYTGFALGQDTNVLTALAAFATAATATSDVGTYAITPSGASAANYTFSYTAGALTITQALTAGAIASSANPALPGASVTFTFAVSAVAPGAGTPSGAVDFRIDGVVAGSAPLSGGSASFSTSALALGSHTVVAEYAGSANFAGATNTLAPAQVINTPPVAVNDIIERYPAQGVKVRLATLLGNDSDTDGDTLTITVSSTSASNGVVSVSGGWVFYTPAAGHTNVDSFTYTIEDGRGGSVTATVTVVLKADNDPGANLAIAHVSGSTFEIRGSGIPGRTYRLQYTDTLNPTVWAELPGGSVTADETGRFTFTDTAGSANRYYRSVYP